MKYLIGIDLGTSATKTILADGSGRILASTTYTYPMYEPDNGWAEQEPEDWKKAAFSTIKEVIKKAGIDGMEVAGIGLSGQMHGLVMLDEKGELLRRSIIWCDQRAVRETEKMLEILPVEKWLEITGNPPIAGWTAAKILWVKEHEPEFYEKCRHILLPKDYVRWALTGIYSADVSDASGMQLMDLRNRVWSEEILELLEIKRELLGELHESQEVVGYILPQVASELGISPKTVVVAGASDNAAAALGTGIVKEGQALTSIGTSAIVYTHLDEYKEVPEGGLHLCCCAVPGCWHTMGGPQSAGLSMEWMKEKFCQDLVQRAKSEGKDFFGMINEFIKDIPPGSHRLVYLPFLMGERTPHIRAWYRGSFIGLNVIHDQAHMFRAIMEGVGYCLADCNEILKSMGVSVSSMRLCGGGSRSPVWREILACLYGCSVRTLKQEEGPAFGAVILAGVGAGLFPNVQEACERLISEDTVTEPDKEKMGIYQQYHKVYDKFYEDLKEDLYVLYHLN